ncbi:MAG: site-specific DNA-methyltransferase [Opitutales bacterium]|nr:site-specific DNA-methyltransferase [Opitutales bacterium]
MNPPFLTTSHGALFATDCLEALRAMHSGVVDTVFADPPFNIGKDYKNGYNDRVAQSDYLSWCREWIEECCRVIKPGGAFFLYATPELAVRFAPMLGEHLDFRHWIAVTMKGTFPRGRKLYPAHYALLYYTRGIPRVFNKLRLPIETCRHCGKEIRDYGGHRDKMNPEGVNLSDVWTDTSPNRHRKFKVRPGVNELKLVIPERAILISTEPGDLVFDPFGGGGSTYQAAEKHRRNWIGTELYDAAHIQKRLEEEFCFSAAQELGFDFSELFTHENHQDQVLRRIQGEGLSARTGLRLSGASGRSPFHGGPCARRKAGEPARRRAATN